MVDTADRNRVAIGEAPAGQSRPFRCGSHSGPRWYVLQTHRGAEEEAVAHLANQDFSTLLPLRRIEPEERKPGQPRKHRKRQPFARFGPAFPGYMFVLFDKHTQPWRYIASTRGVKRLFTYDAERPIPIPIGVVERLMVAMSRNLLPALTIEPGMPIDPGSIVTITAGPLAGQAALVVRSEARALTVGVQLLASGWDAEVPREALEVVR